MVNEKEDFSVVVIALQAEKTLPRLLKSLKGVNEIIICDTGSSDRTCEIAESFGCKVIKVGAKFRLKPPERAVKEWEKKYGYKPSFKQNKGYFHFAKARNYAAQFAKNDFLFTPDADEEVSWDLEKVRALLPSNDHLTYRFCFAWQPDGKCGLEFTHSKFYRKSKLFWRGWVHEVLQTRLGRHPRPPFFTNAIYHKHFQHPSEERSGRISGLQLAVLEEPDNPRLLYYCARELFYKKL